MNRSLACLGVFFAAAVLAACGPRRDTFDVAPFDATGMDISSSSCNAPLMTCADHCVNVQNDPQNCGMCGHACATGQSCVTGICSLQCPSPEAACSGLCVNTQTDRFNCGTCGTACPAGQVCSMAHCSLDCAAGLTTCTSSAAPDAGTHDSGTGGRYCADVHTDRNNCGSCGHACAGGQSCEAGVCVSSCPTGQTLCGSQCIDVTTDPAHCGSCSNACPGGQTCAAGVCSMTCPTGQMYCTDRCLDVTSDRTNCGSCGHTCAAGELCAAGVCAFACPADRVNCSMVCIDTNTDRANCGACGHACLAGEVCVAGSCTVTCAMGTTACGGVCADLTNDVAHCGSCTNACAAGRFCVGGSCAASCLPGQTVCGGVCVNTAVDNANCGYCGGVCTTGYGCLAGYCRPLVGTDASGCTPPSRQCGPICTDVRSDNSNCGACGTACSSDTTCVSGMCVAPCSTGQVRCGTTCTATQFDRTNCGTCGNVCAAGLGCSAGACVAEPTFRIAGLTATACTTVEVSPIIGFDRGGIAVSPTKAMLNGDTSLGTFNPADLTGGVAVGAMHDSLTSDLRDGSVWVLMDSPTHEISNSTGVVTTSVTHLGQIDGTTGALTATRVVLSMPIPIDSSGALAGVMAGFGRILIHGGTGTAGRWWMIHMPGGDVVPLATRSAPTVNASGTDFAYFGIGEYFGGEPYAVFVQDFAHIVRYRISDGTSTPIGTWSDLADMGNITFSTSRNRWYFHHTFTSQFTTSFFPEETFGFCNGTFEMP